MISKVHEVVAIVVKAMGLKEGDAFELAHDGEPLRDDPPIGSFKFDDGTFLDPIASGDVYGLLGGLLQLNRWTN